MNLADAVDLIAGAVPRRAGVWADLGAGEGTFTRALAERIGPDGRIYAVDRDAGALSALRGRHAKGAAQVIPVVADFTERLFDLPEPDGTSLDGMMLANALHFVRDPEGVLARLVSRLRPSGRVVLVEYDRRQVSRWVPHPISAAKLPLLAAATGLSTPIITARRPSAFGGDLYVAVAQRA